MVLLESCIDIDLGGSLAILYSSNFVLNTIHESHRDTNSHSVRIHYLNMLVVQLMLELVAVRNRVGDQ